MLLNKNFSLAKLKIHFYFVSGILEKTLTKFTKKITENENKVLILTANSSSSQNIDSAMWSYEAFLPHILVENHTMDNRLDSTVNHTLNTIISNKLKNHITKNVTENATQSAIQNISKNIDKSVESLVPEANNYTTPGINLDKYLYNVNQKLLETQKILISQNFTYANNPNVLIIFIDENSDIQNDFITPLQQQSIYNNRVSSGALYYGDNNINPNVTESNTTINALSNATSNTTNNYLSTTLDINQDSHTSPYTPPYILSILENYKYFNKVYVFTHKKFMTNILMNDTQMPFESRLNKHFENPFESSAQENLIENIWQALRKESLSVWEQVD